MVPRSIVVALEKDYGHSLRTAPRCGAPRQRCIRKYSIHGVPGAYLPHTAYSTAKFAVKGFSEALIHDFRFNAPHLNVSVVMPGHTGTDILSNSLQILGHNQPQNWTIEEVNKARVRWTIAGRDDIQDMSDAQIRAAGEQEIDNMRATGLPAAQAANTILNGVKNNTWRILIGADTQSLDELVRASPETAYDPDFVDRWRQATGQITDAE